MSASRLQCLPDRRTAPKVSPLTPELRDFIDRAIVPVLVKQYIEMMELAKTARDASHSQKPHGRTKPRKVRP